jgi:Icc-related predicted phosphoesterase
MSANRVTMILCAAAPRGVSPALEHLVEAARQRDDLHALVLLGDLGTGDPAAYRALFRLLASTELPTYWVPGPGDAPVDHYLREAYNVEVVFPLLRGLHGTMAFAPGHVLFAGFGGEVSDDPDAARDETTRLSYPRWEPEYRLKLVRELGEHELVLLLATPPAHKGHGTTGSEALAELVGSHRPRVVVCGGERRSEMLGRSLVVAPGALEDGHYAVVDLHRREVAFEDFVTAAA